MESIAGREKNGSDYFRKFRGSGDDDVIEGYGANKEKCPAWDIDRGDGGGDDFLLGLSAEIANDKSTGSTIVVDVSRYRGGILVDGRGPAGFS